MKVRLKFVIILTLVVTFVTAGSFFLIYFLYSNTREHDLRKRLWAQAYNTYNTYYHITDIAENTSDAIRKYLPVSFVTDELVIVNDSAKIIFSQPGILKYNLVPALLPKIKAAKEYFYTKDNISQACLYFNHSGHDIYVIAFHDDWNGIIRLEKLRVIMFWVALAAILTTGVFSFFYVIYTTRPLVKLSLQMRSVNEGNIKERFKVVKGNIKNNELVQIATNFNNMLDRLERAFELQKSFVHHASHELRTPLTSMLSQTEAALRRDLTLEESKNILQSLKEDQQELIELTNSLLLLSQYEKIRYSSEWPVVRVDEMLYDTITAIKKIFPNISISFEFAYIPDNELSLSINGNDTLLRSAFRNLIKNAFNYSDDKHVAITIGADDREITISFVNHGKILEPVDRERLFIPFFRGVNAQRKKGFGLGLSIVRRIILLHRGTITYNAADDRTNCFIVAFSK